MVIIVKVRENLIGRKFGRLTVIEQVEDHISKSGFHFSNWKCQCDCGNITYVTTSALKSGNTSSCGCLHSELISNYMSDKRKKYNEYEFTKNYGICYDETKEHKWLFDLEDYELIKSYYWSNHNGYAIAKYKELGTTVTMTRIILGLKTGDKRQVDHINHDITDNRKQNLRICTNQQNNMNKGIIKSNKSGVTGVGWDKQKNKWCAQIKIGQRHIHLGLFNNFNDAVNVRKQAEEKYFKEYAYKGDNNYVRVSR